MNIITIPKKAIEYVKNKYGFDIFKDRSKETSLHIHRVVTFLLFAECEEDEKNVFAEILESSAENGFHYTFAHKYANCTKLTSALNKLYNYNNMPNHQRVFESVDLCSVTDKDFIKIVPEEYNYTRDSSAGFSSVRVIVTDEDWFAPNADTEDDPFATVLENTLEQTAKPQEAVSSLVFLSWD